MGSCGRITTMLRRVLLSERCLRPSAHPMGTSVIWRAVRLDRCPAGYVLAGKPKHAKKHLLLDATGIDGSKKNPCAPSQNLTAWESFSGRSRSFFGRFRKSQPFNREVLIR